MTAYFKKNLRGFTLIELLIVMAILGVLAVVVLVAVNPAQQLARARDTGRKSATTQLGRALEAYFTGHNGLYVVPSNTWIGPATTAGSLAASGEISTVPTTITYSIAGTATCTPAANNQNGYCYAANDALGTAPMVVYARMESTAEISKCAATEFAWFVYSSMDGRGGIVCTAAADVPVPGTQSYED